MNKGVTLMELLVASLIATIILGSINMFMVQGYRSSEQIFLQGQVHAALSLISREIEDQVKNGASVQTNGSNELRIYDKDENLIMRYVLENNMMRRYRPGSVNGEDMVGFADVIVEGDFALGMAAAFIPVDITTVAFNLRIRLNGNNSSYSINSQPFLSKCRNPLKI